MSHEIAFEMAASNVRFGAGVTREVGMDLVDLGVRRALVVTDPNLARLAPVQTALAALEAAGVRRCCTIGCASSRPMCRSATRSQFGEAAQVDGIVAVGGGSVIDTAKAVNLYTTYPAGGLPRLRQRADWKGAARPGPAQAAHRHSHDGRNRQRDDGRQHLRSHRAAARKPASRAAGSSRRSACWIPTTRERCRRRWRRRAGSTS